jgi:hypothetical protein
LLFALRSSLARNQRTSMPQHATQCHAMHDTPHKTTDTEHEQQKQLTNHNKNDRSERLQSAPAPQDFAGHGHNPASNRGGDLMHTIPSELIRGLAPQFHCRHLHQGSSPCGLPTPARQAWHQGSLRQGRPPLGASCNRGGDLMYDCNK